MPKILDGPAFLPSSNLDSQHNAPGRPSLTSYCRSISSHSPTIIRMAEPTSDALLFEEQFEVTNIDHKKYDRAARITASSLDRATSLELDINTELFPLTATENIEVALATTLNLDGSRDDEKTWRDVAKPGVHTLADGYNYVCYGKVYKFEDGKADKTLYVP